MKKKILVAHRIVIAGVYLAKPPRRGENGGAAEKKRLPFKEEFEIVGGDSHPHHAIKSNALSHLLRSGKLAERLSAKDPEFRGVVHHEVVEHEDVFKEVDAPDA